MINKLELGEVWEYSYILPHAGTRLFLVLNEDNLLDLETAEVVPRTRYLYGMGWRRVA